MTSAHVLPVLLLALASNLDNIGVGFAYGLRRVRVPLASNLAIAALTAASTLASLFAGRLLGARMSVHIASYLGGSILVLMGATITVSELRHPKSVCPAESPNAGWPTVGSFPTVGKHNAAASPTLHAHPDNYCWEPHRGFVQIVSAIHHNPLAADRDRSSHIDLREALLLALTLSLNNLAAGVAAGITGLPPLVVTVMVAVLSLATLQLGLAAGNRLAARWMNRYAPALSGLLLVLVGLYEMFF